MNHETLPAQGPVDVTVSHEADELFADYMTRLDLQEVVSKWLGAQVYDQLNSQRLGRSA